VDVSSFFLGRTGSFKSAEEIVDVVTRYRSFDQSVEDASHAEALLIFHTSKQQTWLVATNQRLYCVLDDLPGAFTKVQWSMQKSSLTRDGNVAVPISHRDRTDKTGLLDLGERRGWLFSKRLFERESIEDRVRRLIGEHLTPGPAVEVGR
jgi:hypothetical protein